MVSPYLTSALLMGALVLVVITAVVRGRHWYTYAPTAVPARTEGAHGQGGPELLDRTGAWIVTFVLLSMVAVGGVLALVSGPAAGLTLTSGTIVAVAAGLVALYVLLGVYVTARQQGHSSALALAEMGAVFGTLLLLAISIKLVSGGLLAA